MTREARMVRVGASGPRRDLRLHRGGQPARRGTSTCGSVIGSGCSLGCRGVVAAAASKAHASWSLPARRISWPTGLLGIPCAFSAFCTARGNGPTTCRTDNQFAPTTIGQSRTHLTILCLRRARNLNTETSGRARRATGVGTVPRPAPTRRSGGCPRSNVAH
jgi:hypothetical protein